LGSTGKNNSHNLGGSALDTVRVSSRELARVRRINVAMSAGMSDYVGNDPFTQVPRDVAIRLAKAPKIALHLWLAIERWVGRDGGTGDVPQAAIYRELGWARSTYFDARRILILLGMLQVEMPKEGPWHGPGARRRLTLVHTLVRRTRRAVERAAKKTLSKIQKGTGEMHPAAADALQRALDKASAGLPPPTSDPPGG